MLTNKKRINKFEYVIVFLMIFLSADTMMFGTPQNKLYLYVGTLLICFSCIALFIYIYFNCKQINMGSFIILLILILFPLLTLIKGTENIAHTIYLILNIIFAFLIINSINLNDFKKAYVDVITFLALISLLCYFIYYYTGNSFKLFTFYNKSGGRFDSIILCIMRNAFYLGEEYRNWGIFREPGVYQIFLNIALILNLDNVKRKDIIKNVIIILTVLTTKSTAGIIILSAILLMWLITTDKIFFYKKIVILLSVAVLVTIMLCRNNYFINIINKIFLKFTDGNESFVARSSSFVKNFYLTMQAPLLGNGFTYMINNYGNFMGDIYGNLGMHNTNTLLKAFATNGVIYGGILTIGFCKFFYNISNNKYYSICIILMMFLCLSNEDLTLNAMLFLIVFYSFNNIDNFNTIDNKKEILQYESLSNK